MNAASDPLASAACDYCGHDNPDRLTECGGCGRALVAGPPPPAKKSKRMAVCLALVFGPLGLIYVGAWLRAFVMIIFGLPFMLTHTGRFWIPIGVRLICAAWAYHEVIEQDDAPDDKRDAARLFDEAVQLEGVDFTKAIAVYEEVVRRYPTTRAGKQAAVAIETLRRNV